MNALEDEPADDVTHDISVAIQRDGEQRERMTEGMYLPKQEGESLKRIEETFQVVKAAEEIEKKIRKAVKAKQLPKLKGDALVAEALQQGVIDRAEAATLKKAEEMRFEAITVDDFSEEEYSG